MEMNFSQGFKDGYEDVNYDYSCSYGYFDNYYKGVYWRKAHAYVFAVNDRDFDSKIENFKSNHEAAITLMNNFVFD
jgi:hypothetical protein